MKLFSRRFRAFTCLAAAILGGFALSGCVFFSNSRHHHATSVVQFLYPDTNQPYIQPTTPTLRLPLRVGVAFVPSSDVAQPYGAHNSAISEMQKTELLRKVSAQFKALPFVQSIELIPTTYLHPGGGFPNLDQLHSLMGIDVIALIAYDQAQSTSDTPWSFAYWTIVGAYIVPAQKNDTHTLMEAVVYDIPSRSLLFRAPGVSAITGHATLIRTDAELAADSSRSMVSAATDLIANLQSELELFKVRAKEEPESIKIEHKAGYSGIGQLGGSLAGVITLLFSTRVLLKRRDSLRR